MSKGQSTPQNESDQIDAILAARHDNPFAFLGPHPLEGASASVVRIFRPDVERVSVIPESGKPVEATRIHDDGFFVATVSSLEQGQAYELELTAGAKTWKERDPYAFGTLVGDQDIHYFGEGTHRHLYRVLGAHRRELDGVTGMHFALWAPNAKRVSIVGDFNDWDGRVHPMRRRVELGVWEIFLPAVGYGAHYKFEMLGADDRLVLKSDPFAFFSQNRESTASMTYDLDAYQWSDAEWMKARPKRTPWRDPMSTYEVHLGSWARMPDEGDRPLTYLEMAERLPAYVADLGFTHVELMPVTEFPYDPSWGYQVGSYFAPTSRYGTPDEFRVLIDAFHAHGIGVILDWVPAHFPKDESALSRFDGTALFEHEDPRLGEHPDWGTLIFNYGRNEVRNFLVASALFWLREYHIDGIRVDAVASMLYLDYGREEGQWLPNSEGGRENHDAVHFLRDLNRTCYHECPGIVIAAEESTAWPGVTQSADHGGLGFGFKWNMGWMNDYLEYMSKEPVHRKYHHNEATFSLVYAWDENFILPLSHDEVVHGKGSLLSKMPGDGWQCFANLRLLYSWMYLHPGKKLLFMGSEFAQGAEWNFDASLDWHLLEHPDHLGIQKLVKRLNELHRSCPQLHVDDFEPSGWEWLEANAAEDGIFAFLRLGPNDQPLVCALNVTPVPRKFRLGVPSAGPWQEVFNSDDLAFGGSGVVTADARPAEAVDWQGFEQSVEWTIPPLGAVVLSG